MLKNQKGITLVALVVTIIVLVILATVSIKLVMDNNGTLEEAKKAANMAAQDSLNTEAALRDFEAALAEQMNAAMQ